MSKFYSWKTIFLPTQISKFSKNVKNSTLGKIINNDPIPICDRLYNDDIAPQGLTGEWGDRLTVLESGCCVPIGLYIAHMYFCSGC